jgi:hypothetical protein
VKRVQHHPTTRGDSRDNLLHVETDGCIVNIRVGLTDTQGRRVTSVEVIPDNYAGEEWHLDGTENNRVVEGPSRKPAIRVNNANLAAACDRCDRAYPRMWLADGRYLCALERCREVV